MEAVSLEDDPKLQGGNKHQKNCLIYEHVIPHAAAKPQTTVMTSGTNLD